MPTNGVWTWSSSRALLSTYQTMKIVTATGVAASNPATSLLRRWAFRRPMVPRLDAETKERARIVQLVAGPRLRFAARR